MVISIGYACLVKGVPNTDFKSITAKNVTENSLLKIIEHNLNSLENIIDYNIREGIKLFRISSDLIPFGSNDINRLHWWEIFAAKFKKIGAKIKAGQIRVSMHPGQYTVLNSNRNDVVKRAYDDLKYHLQVLESLDTSQQSKIILHVGGVYNDKKAALIRFKTNFLKLDQKIKKRLIIENDEKSYNVQDVYLLAKELQIPAVFDNLHHQINGGQDNQADLKWIKRFRTTWKAEDGLQKIHYSQQAANKKAGSHSQSIVLDPFLTYFNLCKDLALDIMLEVKDKNISCLKCQNLLRIDNSPLKLEQEWSKYKYLVLERSPQIYLQIRQLLKDKAAYPSYTFYKLIEEALSNKATLGLVENSANHVWGYLKNITTSTEKNRYFKLMSDLSIADSSLKKLKKYLWNLSLKYQIEYLLNSYYFVEWS